MTNELRHLSVSARSVEIALATALLLFSVAIIVGAMRMPIGTASAPGPGFFPRLLGWLLALVSAVLLLCAIRLAPVSDRAVSLGNSHVLMTLASVVGLAFVFDLAGYIVSAVLFLFVLIYALSKLGWLRSLIIAVSISLVSYYLFAHLLGIRLPAGWVGWP